jgi:putative transposase
MVLRYVEGNPVRAQMVNTAKNWIWSSHGEMIGERKRLFVDEAPIKLPMNWDRYVDEPLENKKIKDLRQSINRQSPYGDIKWQIQVSKMLGLESTLNPRGRPIKR